MFKQHDLLKHLVFIPDIFIEDLLSLFFIRFNESVCILMERKHSISF